MALVRHDAPIEERVRAFQDDLARIRDHLCRDAVAPARKSVFDPHAPVIITARFRTGSTMLLDLFRRSKQYHCLCEPCHENLVAAVERQVRPHYTHRTLERPYFDEYRHYDFRRLAALHQARFATDNIWMSEAIEDGGMAEYLRYLHAAAPRRALFQFNRADLRLPWLRALFPGAPILHLWRHPRDQWLSCVKPPAEHFTLYDRIWSTSLHPYLSVFPRFPHREKRDGKWLPLRERPDDDYRLFFLLWLLSMVWARVHADCSVAYENLVAAPSASIRQIGATLGLPPLSVDAEHLVFRSSIGGWKSPQTSGRWLQIESPARPETWYEGIEAQCRAEIETALASPLPEVCYRFS